METRTKPTLLKKTWKQEPPTLLKKYMEIRIEPTLLKRMETKTTYLIKKI